MSHIFISYSRKNSDFVMGQLMSLQRKYRLWWDKTDIHGGDDWQKAIRQGLSESIALLVVLSPDAVASDWVQFEYETALELGIPVIPLVHQDCEMPVRLRNVHHIRTDDPDWYEALMSAVGRVPRNTEAELCADQSKIEALIGKSELKFADAAEQMAGSLHLDKDGLGLVALPMLITRHAVTYLVGQSQDTLQRAPQIQLAWQITQGYNSADFPVQVAQYVSRTMRLHMILVRGPMMLFKGHQGISMVHGLDNHNPDEWQGVINAGFSSIESYHKGTARPEMIHVFNIAPAALMGAVGLRFERGVGVAFYNFVGRADYQSIYSVPPK